MVVTGLGAVLQRKVCPGKAGRQVRDVVSS